MNFRAILVGIALLGVAAAGIYCGKTRDQAMADRVNDLVIQGKLEEARTLLSQRVATQPASSDLLRAEVWLNLKDERSDEVERVLSTFDSDLDRLDALRSGLSHSDAGVRTGAAYWLSRNPSPAVEEALLEALEDPTPQVRAYAAGTLGKLKSKRAIHPMFQLLSDDHWNVRANACEALALIGDPRAAGWLVQRLGDRDGYTRYKAAVALRDLVGPENKERLLRELPALKGKQQLGVAYALSYQNEPEVLPVLIAGAETNEADSRELAASALGNYNAPSAIEKLQQLLADPEPGVRAEARKSIERLQSLD